MIEQRTRVIGVSQEEERVDCNNILHQRRSDQSEKQRDDVVKVVYVPGVDMSVLERQLSCVPMFKWLIYAVYN
jgi:hypothetical protein